MIKAIRERAVVKEGGVIEIRSPEMPKPGTAAEVVVLFDDELDEEPLVPLTELIGSAKGLFPTPEDADAYLDAERDSWES